MNPLDLFTTLGVDDATHHGVGPLVVRERRRRGMDVPPELDEQVRQLVMIEVLRGVELDTLFAHFENARLPLLVIKGTALAYTIYEHPSQRPRCDTDVVVRINDIAAARAILEDCGYAEEPSAGSEIANGQRIFSRVDRLGVRHAIDLHWRTLNRPRLARAFRFEELWSRAVPFRGRNHVRIPSTEDALLLAAAHLAAHHAGQTRLIWLNDLHLLAREADFSVVIRRAQRKGIARELASALMDAAECGGHAAAPSRLHELAEDLRYTQGVRTKMRLMREHLLPSADHVMRKYGTKSRFLLPFLYIRRVLGFFSNN